VGAVRRGTPIIAPCNGFQIAAQLGLLPGPLAGEDWPDDPPTPSIALATNDSARFSDRWCRIEIPATTRCVWTHDLTPSADNACLPIAHGEGRVTVEDASLLQRLERGGQIALRYANADNPNGSMGNIAGICDASGLVFGLMPHPERFTSWLQHPQRTRLDRAATDGEKPLGLQMFHTAVQHVRQRKHAPVNDVPAVRLAKPRSEVHCLHSSPTST
jgi:phosphoribosylformylglycinamidine synthase